MDRQSPLPETAYRKKKIILLMTYKHIHTSIYIHTLHISSFIYYLMIIFIFIYSWLTIYVNLSSSSRLVSETLIGIITIHTHTVRDGSFSFFFFKRSFRYENDDEKTKNETTNFLKTIVFENDRFENDRFFKTISIKKLSFCFSFFRRPFHNETIVLKKTENVNNPRSLPGCTKTKLNLIRVQMGH